MVAIKFNRLFVIVTAWLIVAGAGLAAEFRRESAKDILAQSGIKGGLIVHVGCGDGEITATLPSGDSFVVHGLDADPNHVGAARECIYDVGMSGTVSIARWNDLRRLPYAENMVNLLLVEDIGELSDDEMRRVLVPNGLARIKNRDGRWRTIRKPWPADMDGWSHWDHGADGNPVSQDEFVGPPRRTQWIDGPSWSKKHWGPRLSAIVSSGGRLYYVQDETPTSLFNIESRWVLIARDAFNGVVLWRREVPEWTGKDWGQVVRRGGEVPPETGMVLGVWGELTGGSGVRDAMDVMVADDDYLYVPLSAKGPLSAINGATGEVVRSYEQVAPVQQVVLSNGILLISGRGKVCAVRAETGRLLWETSGSYPRVAGDKVFVMDRKGTVIAAVGLESGERLWEVTFAAAFEATGGRSSSDGDAFTGPLQVGAGIVLAGSGDRSHVQTTALSAGNGSPLWRSAIGDRYFGRGGGPFIIDNLVWSLDAAKGALIARNAQTGQIEQEVAAPAIRYAGHHARCYLSRATCRYIIGKERGADFIDLESGTVSWNNWVRGPCHRGVLPANGLLYAAQHSCRCYTEAALHGFHALAPAWKSDVGNQKSERLEKGPAYGWTPTSDLHPASSDSWPTFRHDGMRSGATSAQFPSRPEVLWAKELAGKLTAPVAAWGRVFIAATDRHTLYSLDARSGEILWHYITGGRIDTPPTIHRGLVLFGCRDGWVYCLRFTDGSLVWRFRAAPEDRFVGAHGQLESAWPIPGSVLVKDNIAYCVAGRSSYLDGGLRILALNPQTGKLLHEKRLDGPWPEANIGASPETPNRGFTSEGALPDVLVADTDFIYLRHLKLDASLQRAEDMKPNVYVSPELTGENRGGDHKYWDNLLEVPRHVLFTDPNWFHRSYFQNFPGRRLYATTGLIDDDGWHRRMYWSYGQVVGQYLVFRGSMGYAVQVFATSPREGGFNAGDGYVVYAGRTAENEDRKKLFALRPDQTQWRIRVPFRPIAMVLAGNKLILAGPPDSANPREALAAMEGQRGGMLWVIDASNGGKSAECRLESSPRYDGMAVAEGRCYITTTDGRLMCLGDTIRQWNTRASSGRQQKRRY